MLREEVEQLRFEANHTALISNFTDLMYDAANEKEVLSILLFAIPQLMEIAQMRFFKLNKKSLHLEEQFMMVEGAEKVTEVNDGLTVPLNFFGGTLADSVLRQETFNIENGIEEGDELSLRFQSDRYMLIPLISRNLKKRAESTNTRSSFRTEEEYLKACIKADDFPVLGVFWLDTSSLPDIAVASSISLVTSLFHTAAAVIGELRMVDQIVSINERTEKDLKAAREVQLGLLPKKLPNNDVIQASAQYLTEDQVGGDYYDIFELAPGIYGIMVADASGHGTPSALIMTMTKILLKTFAESGHKPSETLEKINEAIVNNAKTNKFITSFYAILDTNENKLHYTSAGHCPQILLSKSKEKTVELTSDGVFIGMFPFLNLESHTIEYTKGDNRLVLYTDGLTESTNNDEMMYGSTRLGNSAVASAEEAPEDAIHKMLDLFNRFIRNHPKDDDLTLMVVDF